MNRHPTDRGRHLIASLADAPYFAGHLSGDHGAKAPLAALAAGLRVLLYSHDTFGLGHLRRNCKIANALADAFPAARIVLVTGSRKAGSYALRPSIELVRLPSVVKSADGHYYAADGEASRRDVLEERARHIVETVRNLQPHLFIADKEPLGLLGELEEALQLLRQIGTRLVLGLRDVLDEPDVLKQEWAKKNITPQIDGLYDSFWVYGPRDFYNPLIGLDLSGDIAANTHFLGHIETRPTGDVARKAGLPDNYVLVTAGGGGDGEDLMSAVLSAYRCDPSIPLRPVFLLGPFMEQAVSDMVRARAALVPGSVVVDFDAEPERLLANAAGVVSMCGYNTFCEIMSHDRPSLFIPREKPRLEQYIRAERATELRLCAMMRATDALADPASLAGALRRLAGGPRPSTSPTRLDMGGLEALCLRVENEIFGLRALERVSHG